ncbi:hypothetical protein PFISCL1PPCAC_15997 [Pristionchus fissidentatus]|uniref:CRC domain-containing protein n=1 Tax=Pristionchus fissidentatus TaxID=1538716 RepID=A0AAV5W1V4_9BILA|nr:hypothetical protein PFISCL1PPCAC_15997 [Pristionchus fissidentatus]
MEGEHEIVDGDQVIVEEIVDEGEVYDESQVYGEDDALFIEGSDELVPGEYFQLASGELVPTRQIHLAAPGMQQSQVKTVQQIRPQQMGIRRPMQNENSSSSSMNQVYAIRGNQVFRVDKNAGGVADVKNAGFKMIPKTEADASMPSSSNSTYGGQSGNRFQAFRRDPAAFAMNAAPKPKKKQATGHRKPCNCTKSMCLKLYCECFANGEFCRDCNCKDCHNSLDHENERTRAIKSSLERNPNAFKPKIVSGAGSKGKTDSDRLHMKGCHCKKSNCLKNYCECYEAKVACTDRCKCCGCKNTEVDRASKYRDRIGPTALLSLANVASLTDARHDTPFSDEESDGEAEEKSDPKTMPWFYLTDEVVEASTLCLVAQAEQVERENDDVTEDLMERVLMAEFSNCLQSIISSAADATAAAKAAKATVRQQRALEASPPPELATVTAALDA